MRLLTPEYASPEQVRGEPVSTAADVYALGAVLYELLSGAQAQRIEGEGMKALLAILEVDPPLPSLVAPASRRRAIAGDLDNIVMKPSFVSRAGPTAALIVKKEAIALGRLNERVPPTPFVDARQVRSPARREGHPVVTCTPTGRSTCPS